MNDREKALIKQYRLAGKRYKDISVLLNLSVNTVKSYCKRNAIPAADMTEKPAEIKGPLITGADICRQCGKTLERVHRRRKAEFCSDACRLQWWHANRSASGNVREHTCPACGITFISDREQKYCSHDCYVQHRFRRKQTI